VVLLKCMSIGFECICCNLLFLLLIKKDEGWN
jgi:hypothetical protein